MSVRAGLEDRGYSSFEKDSLAMPGDVWVLVRQETTPWGEKRSFYRFHKKAWEAA